MKIDQDKANEALRHGVLTGFIPHRLEIDGRPELSLFPLNVLFAKQKMENNQVIRGSALYTPEFDTIMLAGTNFSMRYRNSYGGESYLIIEYNFLKRTYTGSKFVHEKLVGMADGNEWNPFFIHFTILGLVNGERCLFDPPESVRLIADAGGV